ncbi:MAG: hypothetical protein IJI03_12320 [Rudaea sp.]|nr:hypothetical protein [Rudaea sp.]
MIDVQTNAGDVAAKFSAKAEAIPDAVGKGVRSWLLATEAQAVRNLTGGGAAWTYPVPVRTGNLRGARTVQQPSPGIGIIQFTAAYAWAIHTGKVTQWAGRGKTRQVQKTARPFAQDAGDKVPPDKYVIGAVAEVLRT